MAPLPTPPTAPEAEFSPAVLAQLRRLQARYAADNQDLAAYLEGLYHADYVSYWDYIELDTLLSLQRPLTKFRTRRYLSSTTRLRSCISSSACTSMSSWATCRSPRWAK